MVSHCIRPPSETPLPCDMDGALKTYPVSVSVEYLFLWITLSLVAVVGFSTLRHNELRDLTASLFSEVCTNVAVEPPLQELSGEELSGATANRESGARLDIVADGFWCLSRERTYFDIRVFNPYAISNQQSSLSQPPTEFMREKRRGNIYSASVTWNTALFPHLCSPLLVEWPRKHLSFTNAWPHSSLRSINKSTVTPWLG